MIVPEAFLKSYASLETAGQRWDDTCSGVERVVCWYRHKVIVSTQSLSSYISLVEARSDSVGLQSLPSAQVKQGIMVSYLTMRRTFFVSAKWLFEAIVPEAFLMRFWKPRVKDGMIFVRVLNVSFVGIVTK